MKRHRKPDRKGDIMDYFLNQNTFSAIFWTACTFAILAGALAVFAWPKILSALQEREKRIQGEIKRAEELRVQAEQKLAQYADSINQARIEAQKIIEEGKADAESLKARYLEEQRKEAEASRKRSLREIELARDKALEEIHHRTVELSLEIASKIMQKSLDKADQARLIEEALAEVEKTAGV
jgi:F-type H+-transporting ATPase subunit b